MSPNNKRINVNFSDGEELKYDDPNAFIDRLERELGFDLEIYLGPLTEEDFMEITPHIETTYEKPTTVSQNSSVGIKQKKITKKEEKKNNGKRIHVDFSNWEELNYDDPNPFINRLERELGPDLEDYLGPLTEDDFKENNPGSKSIFEKPKTVQFNAMTTSDITEEKALDEKRAKAAESLRRRASKKQKVGAKRKMTDDGPTSKAKRPAIESKESNNAVTITSLSPNTTLNTLKALVKQTADVFQVHYNNGEDKATVLFDSKESAIKFRRMKNRAKVGDSHIVVTFKNIGIMNIFKQITPWKDSDNGNVRPCMSDIKSTRS
ncbi:hypothetical protein K501DRAFT_333533 [Backusella circina FSU 941]|nr:hypothetical protein K501DRAFT_333533 [Backusella circina FSU 941]